MTPLSFNFSELNGSNGFILNGINGGDRLGFSVSGAGDINGDGLDDLIIGARDADPNGNSDAGQSYVVFGRSGGFSPSFDLSQLNGSNGFAINGINSGGSLEGSVGGAGDINGDGIDDLIIGASFAGSNIEGQSYVVFGRSGGFSSSFDLSQLNGSNGFVLNGIDNGDLLGVSVSGAGDINGDGIDDLIIGADRAGPNIEGQSYVVFGRSGGFSSSFDLSQLNGSNGFALNGLNLGDSLGVSVSGAGDINGDGLDDLIIGAVRADPNGNSDAGQSYVVFGRSGGFSSSFDLSQLNGSNGFAINGIDSDDRLGGSVSGAGDINGDGLDDLIIGALGADLNGSFSGQSYVVFGRSGGFSSSFDLSQLNGSNGFAINGINVEDASGASVSGAGDINGDGIDDLIIGAPGADPNGNSDAGQSYVVFGRSGGFNPSFNLSQLNGSNGFALNGIDNGDRAGSSVSGAGDINGDGIDELIIGADRADSNGNSRAGQSYVVFGRRGGFRFIPLIPLVDTLVDENDGDLSPGDVSLREAIALAENGATIGFSPTLSGGTIALTFGELAIDNSLTIEGLGENNLTISGNNESRLFRIGGNTEVTIDGLTLTDGFSETDGGAIDNRGVLNLSNTNIRDSFAGDDGGGISNFGTLRLTSSTLSNNIAEDDGGGIGNFGGTVEATHSIFSRNAASDDGGGIFNFNGTVQLIGSTLTENAVENGDGGGTHSFRGTTAVNNTIISGNFDEGGESPDVEGNFTSNGFNLIGISDGSTGFSNGVNGDIVGTSTNPINSQLGDLQDNHAPLVGSPVIDAGDPNVTGSDRFGTSRPQGAGVDIGAVEFQFFDTLTVDTLVDELDGDLSPGDVSLREAIFATAAGGTIDFAESLTGGTLALTLGTLSLDKNLTVQGLGADNLTIDGNETFRIFSIDSNADIEISGLTLANGGNPSSSGSAIFNAGTLNLSDSVIRDSRGRFGGGINNQGNLSVVNSTIRNNQEAEGEGGGGIRNSGTATLLNSTVSDNLGGGISSNSVLSAIDSTIGNNTGNGIRNDGSLRVSNSTIQNNTESGIRNSGDVTLLNSTISGNQSSGILNAGTLNVTNSTITNNQAFRGGGIVTTSGTVTLGNTIVAGNTDSGSIGGRDTSPVSYPDVEGTFISNGNNLIGSGEGSTGFVNGSNGDRVGTNANPIDPGLAPLADNGGATFTHALLADSPAVNAGNNANLPADTEDLDGDGDTSEPLPVDQRGVERVQNGFVDIGALESGIETRPTVSLEATDTEASENAGDVGTYTLTRIETNGELTVNLSLDGNSTASLTDDYTLEVNGTPINPSNSNFSLTFAEGESELTIRLIPVDDVLAEDAEIVTLNLNEDIEYAIDPLLNTGTITLAANDLSVVNNTNDSGLGSLRQAILNANANPGADTITFEGTLFADDTPDTIALTSGELQITDNLTIQGLGTNNLTVSGTNASRVFNVDDGDPSSQIDVAIDGLTITQGNTTGNGGGIVSQENLTITNSAIANNTADNGGGIASFSGTLDIVDTTITLNDASNGVGGGIQQLDDAIVNISNSTINGNTATGNGAGIDANPSPGGFAFNVTNSTISGNLTTNGSGGGLSLGGNALMRLSHSTVTNNTTTLGSGGGIANRFGGSLELASTIVAANFAATNPDIRGGVQSRGFNLIGNGSGATGLMNGVNGDLVGTATNPIAPRLASLADNGGATFTHALQPGSPAIDAGNNANAPTTDQRGISRPQDGDNDGTATADIGAFEVSTVSVNSATDIINGLSGDNVLHGDEGDDILEWGVNNDIDTVSDRNSDGSDIVERLTQSVGGDWLSFEEIEAIDVVVNSSDTFFHLGDGIENNAGFSSSQLLAELRGVSELTAENIGQNLAASNTAELLFA